MNYILGSGIIGLMARHLLGPSWKIIPFYKSRIYSFKPALCDNFIIHDDRLNNIMSEFDVPNSKYSYRIGQSYLGQITQSDSLCEQWLNKVYKDAPPPHAIHYWKNRLNISVYNAKINDIYDKLLVKYLPEIKQETQKGLVTKIEDHKIFRSSEISDYDKIINTIPLDALYKILGHNQHLPSRPIYYHHIATDSLNFEGMQQLLVVDRSIPFFKVTNLQQHRYLFYSLEDIPNPGIFYMNYLNRFDILEGTMLDSAIPMGPLPNNSICNKNDITCIGAYASWDWCLDVGSCILRILNLCN